MTRRSDFRILAVVGVASTALVLAAAALVIREVIEWVQQIQALLGSLPQ